MKKELLTIDCRAYPPKVVDRTLIPLSLLMSGLFFTFYDDGSYLNLRESRVRTWKIENNTLYFKVKDRDKGWQVFSKVHNEVLVKIFNDVAAEKALFDV